MFEKLKLFVEIASANSVSKAADKLHITQSTVSAQLKALETYVGMRLFDRVGRAIKLNKNGEIFLAFAKETLANYSQTHEKITDKDERPQQLTICAGGNFNSSFMPAAFIRFQKKSPHVDIRFVTMFSDVLIEAMENQEYEFGIVANSGPVRSPNVQVDFMFEYPLMFVISTKNPLSRKTEITPDDIKEERFINSYPNPNYKNYISTRLAKGHYAFESHLVIDTVDAIKAAALADLGITILPKYVVDREVQEGALAAIPAAETKLTRRLLGIHNTERPMSQAAVDFMNITVELLDERPEFTKLEHRDPERPMF